MDQACQESVFLFLPLFTEAPDPFVLCAIGVLLYIIGGFIFAAGLRHYSPQERAAWICIFPLHAAFQFALAHRKSITTIGVPALYFFVVWQKYQERSDFDFSIEVPHLLWESSVTFFGWAVGLLILACALTYIKLAVDAVMEKVQW